MYIKNYILNLQNIKGDTILICCSSLRVTTYDFINKLEKEIGIPVITSNQALIWDCLVKGDISSEELLTIKGYGSLFN